MRMLLPLLLLLAACAHRPAAVVQTPPPAQSSAPPAKPPMTQKEYEEANAAVREPDAAKRLPLIDLWAQDFPASSRLEERQDLYLQTYVALKDARRAFDTALAILKTRPNNLQAAADALQMVMQIKPAPADLDGAEAVADRVVFDTRSLFSLANKPKNISDGNWRKTEQVLPPYAEAILVGIYGARHDDKRAVDDLTKLIQHDPLLPAASYQLGNAMLRVLRDENRPESQPVALWQFARAASYDGPNALPAEQRQTILIYLNKAYPAFHGSADGLSDLLAAARYSPFPPANFRIESSVDREIVAASYRSEERARGVTLTPLDAATVDDSSRSANAATAASITFVNRSSEPVDIYWMNYDGQRVLYCEGLAVGASCEVKTFLTHPWLVVASGTGGTAARDSGRRIAGFEALTTNGDTAIISSPETR